MDIKALLNPEGESHWHILTETSDREIYEAVINAIEACENMDINGGDDIDGIPADPCPTHCEVLKAVSTIHRYIEDLNDPIARTMETHLASLSMKIRLDGARCMKNTLLTKFFPKL